MYSVLPIVHSVYFFVSLETLKKWSPQFDAKAMVSEHPLVTVHPETSERTLFVNAAYVDHIVGLTPRESQCLLEYLLEHCLQAEFMVRFRWSPGSVAFWDNRATQHQAIGDIFETDFDRDHFSLNSPNEKLLPPHPLNPPADEPRPDFLEVNQGITDLANQAKDISISREELAAALLSKIVQKLKAFPGQGFSADQSQFNALDIYFEKEIEAVSIREKIHGTSEGVDMKGRYQIRSLNGDLAVISAAELSLRAAGQQSKC